ncbi:MAG: cell division ATP-binding protein FtsE [Bdellovibrionales bacterium]
MLLSFDQVSLHYGQNRPALVDVSFQLAEGGFYFLTGPSGAGKSTLLRLVYGAVRPTSGAVYLFGKNIAGLTRSQMAKTRRQLGVVFQDFRLIPYLTAFENAALPLRLAGVPEDHIRKHTTELLEWVGLGDKLNMLPAGLSGGEQQRIAIARAVMNRPKLLLADEPTGNIDDKTAIRILHLIMQLNKAGTAIILATHQRILVDTFRKPELRLLDGYLSPPEKIKAA